MKFKISYSIWDEGDYVVTIRPDFEKEWKSLSIGDLLSKEDAKKMARWLQSAMPTLWKIFTNVSQETE